MKRILIVDDAAFMRASIKRILERNGFGIAGEAEDGEAGVQKYQELRPDIVTMDITMPVMTGLEALRKIKELDPDAKVVIISAMGQEHLVREAIISGAKTFIVKPFTEEHMMMTLNKI